MAANLHGELHTLNVDLYGFTVDKLKLTLRGMNGHPVWANEPMLKMTGLKAELLARVKDICDQAVRSNDQRTFAAIRGIINDVKSGGGAPVNYAPVQTSASYAAERNEAARRLADAERQAARRYEERQAVNDQRVGHTAAARPMAGGSFYPQQPQPTRPQLPAPSTIPIKFRSSPFYRIDKALSSATECVRAGQGDRKTVTLGFALTQAQQALLTASALSPTAPQYQVRLFGTNEQYFNPSRSASSQSPVPIDFPSAVEITFNNCNVPPISKGVKKQVGSTPPVNLGATKTASGNSALILIPGRANRLEVHYSNTERRHFLIVYLVEVISVKQVVAKIKLAKYRSKEDVIASIIQQNADPDLEASAFGLTLMDPLTLARIKTPVRSTACSHIACFDADVFFMMNEQTPIWKCPICDNVLRVEDISVDGYFANILTTCPSSVELVNVEPDGSWRSSDDKYGTAAPKQSRAATAEPTPIDKGKAKAENQDSLTIDSDDDAPLVKKRPFANINSDSPRGSRAGTADGITRKAEVIDLTLSDSDDEEVEPKFPARTAAEDHPQYAAYGNVRAIYDREALQQADAKRRISLQEEQYSELSKRNRMD